MRSVWRALLGPHAPDHRMLIGTMCWIDHRCASGHFPGIFPFSPFPFRRFPLPFPPFFLFRIQCEIAESLCNPNMIKKGVVGG